MKKVFTFISLAALAVCMFLVKKAVSQLPQTMSYQAIIHDNQNHLVVNQSVGIQITILQGLPNGTVVYSETQTPVSNDNGLISIEIGGGSGFSLIDWSTGPFFLKTETDPAGGNNYTISATSQLLSVPYSLYSKSAENYNESDPAFTDSPSNGITGSNVSNWNTAYGWGNHSGLYLPVTWVPAWTDVTGKPSTLAGYGITDGVNTSGDQTISGTKTFSNTFLTMNGINSNNKAVTHVADPVNAQDVATKGYVDVLKVRIEGLQKVVGTANKVKDIDGNIYTVIQIGNQFWMAENLKTTRFRNGTVIPLVTDNTAWSNLTTPGYCWYNNNQVVYGSTYGALYNWYTVNPFLMLCPAGWHVPTDADWTTLTTYLGGESIAGGKLKETGTSHWDDPNRGATNETGFLARPGGRRSVWDGTFFRMHTMGFWWTATGGSLPGEAWYRDMSYDSSELGKNVCRKPDGLSIRCIKD